MPAESEHLRLLQAERSAEAARALAHRREVEHRAGVAWSGLGPDPFRPRDDAELARAAAARLAALQSWRHTRPARLLAAMVQAERAVEAVRACAARGLTVSDARCGLALADLERAAAAARCAMDATPPGALSDRPCATSIGSSNPSIA